ncbi:hypothetical protein L0Y65_06625, partial [Candidatus Micrarchaeota archaeon]|nr:hypothetical protein [Candidatus Micrarchaeota archaeon]
MAGGKAVGGPDATGMAQAQNADRAQQAAQRAQTFIGRKVNLLSKEGREENRIHKGLEADARDREIKRRNDEKLARKESQDSAANVDEGATEGAHLTDFNRVFLDAIRRGQSRTASASSADSSIREVVCSETFIRAIANCAIRTPLEQMDTEYGKEQAGRRAKLAAVLTKARENKEYMLGELTTHDVDIIYATMLGTAEEDAIMKTPGAAELWANTAWPADLPKPPDAFFMFLESVAIRERPDEKGRFIGNVLKALTIRKTFVDTSDTTLRTLVDGTMINEYLHTSSSYPIDT